MHIFLTSKKHLLYAGLLCTWKLRTNNISCGETLSAVLICSGRVILLTLYERNCRYSTVAFKVHNQFYSRSFTSGAYNE